MMEQKVTSELGITELNRTIDEYRAKVDELVKKERERLRQLADSETNSIIEGARQKAQDIITESQREAQKIRDEIENQSKKEASKIISEAQYKAQQIISEAESRDKKEAKNRTKVEVERILSEAREESNFIISHAKKAAEKEASEIIGRSREEAERIIKQEVEKYRADVQAQLSQEMAEAQKRAQTVIEGGIASCNEVYDLITQIVQKTEATVDGFKNELQTELGELTGAIALTRKKMEQVTADNATGNEILAAIPELGEKLNQEAILLVQLDGKKSGTGNGNNPLFKGGVKLRADSSCDYKQIRKLRDFLLRIPNIKFTGESTSEEEIAISLEITESLPFFDILSNVPAVDKVITQGDSAKLILNTKLR